MRFGFRFKALALAGREAGWVLRLCSALLLNTMVAGANPKDSHIPQTSAPDKSSTESPIPTPRPVDQAHVMADVAYHFANLWFAVENHNWPLAQYYLAETRSHLAWAVSIHPVRKTSTGAEVDLKGILDAVDNSFLSEVAKASISRTRQNSKPRISKPWSDAALVTPLARSRFFGCRFRPLPRQRLLTSLSQQICLGSPAKRSGPMTPAPI